MGLVSEVKYTGMTEKGRMMEVVRKDHTGRALRISKYLFSQGIQKPVSEIIFDSKGGSTVYFYNETGKDVSQVIRFDTSGRPIRD